MLWLSLILTHIAYSPQFLGLSDFIFVRLFANTQHTLIKQTEQQQHSEKKNLCNGIVLLLLPATCWHFAWELSLVLSTFFSVLDIMNKSQMEKYRPINWHSSTERRTIHTFFLCWCIYAHVHGLDKLPGSHEVARLWNPVSFWRDFYKKKRKYCVHENLFI